MSNLKTKKEVYVNVGTKKQAKKLKKVLDMFGERHFSDEYYVDFDECIGCAVHFWNDRLFACCYENFVSNIKKEVSIKELRNILAKEHYTNKELEVGKWYKFESLGEKYLLNYNGSDFAYGFMNSNWDNSWAFSEGGNQLSAVGKEATAEEVEQALVEEAKGRGFVNGCIGNNSNIHDKKLKDCELFFNNEYEFDDKDNLLRVILDADTTWTVFKDGKWAEVVEQEYDEPKVGDVCKFQYSDEPEFVIGILEEIDEEGYYYCGGDCYPHAEIVDEDEVIELLFGDKE